MVSTQAKRKKTADMPDSPPKRVTRARAAKLSDEVNAKPVSTKITTASTRAAAEKKKAVASIKAMAPAKTTKRKAKAEDGEPETVEALETPAIEEPVLEEQPDAKKAKGKNQQKKGAVAEQDEVLVAEAPKSRGRQPRATAATRSAKFETEKPRGRPKKVPEPASTDSLKVDQIEEKAPAPAPAKKTLRGRTVASAPKTSLPTNSSRSMTATIQKKVKFEEDHDKENVPLKSAAPKKSAMKSTALNAKPVRKPAVTRTTTRGRKITQPSDEASSEKTKKLEAMPLSPKKINQVAKSDPISEDELASEKTPVRALSKSPTKRPISPIKDVGSVSNSDFNQSTAPPSPTKPASTSILASPARRPPPSPFKDCLKSSPKKMDLGDSVTQPVLFPSRTPSKAPLLQESPKRGVLADSAIKPILLPSKSPTKATLLQSPARRPHFSPAKLPGDGSSQRSTPDSVGSNNSPSPKKASPIKAPRLLAGEVVDSCFVDAELPEEQTQLHFNMNEERSPDVSNDASSASPPTILGKQEELDEAAPVLQELDVEANKPAFSDKHISVEQSCYVADGKGGLERSGSPEVPVKSVAPAFSIGSASLRRISLESESSEDELASPQKIYEITPLKRPEIVAKDFATPEFIREQDGVQGSNSSVSFTPLADQLSSWNASDPNRQTRPRQARGMFSFGGAITSPVFGEPTPGRVHISPAKVSFFEDEMAIRDKQDEDFYMETATENEHDLAALKVSQDSQDSEEYGDENVLPNDSKFRLAERDADQTVTCTLAKVFTPARVIHRPGELHTVCKVPLRPSAEESPLKVPRQRSRSFGGPLATVTRTQSIQGEHMPVERPNTPVLAPSLGPQTPSSSMKLDSETPGRTIRKGIVPDVLKGAVVHVDVHTTEGADASGIFVDLLTQMGARCVKQWHWNPRTSMGNSLDSNASPQGLSPDATVGKIGITHVVYKDGGKRTLEKVRSSNGVVHCVGVGWVLE